MIPLPRHPAIVLATTLASVLLLWAVTSHAGEPHNKVILQLHWQHQFEYAGYYAAQYKGYFAEEGLDVHIQELTNRGTSIQMVLSGEAQYGISPSAIILNRMQGKPLVLLANDLKSSPLSLLAASKYTKLSQLKGRKVMAAPDESLNAEIVYMLKANGIAFDDLEWIPHTQKTADVMNGHAAAMTAYQTNQPYELITQNIPYTIFNPRDYGIDFYGNFFFTSQDEIQNNPQRVRKILNASRRGWDYALAHPEETIDYIMATYATKKSRDALEFEATEISKLVSSTGCSIGAIDPQKVDNIARMFIALDMADTAYDLTGFIAAEADICQGNADQPQTATLTTNRSQMSIEEQDYLTKRPSLTACITRDWPPYQIVNGQGNVSGMVVDFAGLLGKHIGTKINPVVTQNWAESLTYAENRKCDMLLLTAKSPAKEKYLTFTESVFDTHFVIIGRSNQGYSGGLEALSGQTLVLFRGHDAIKTIRQDYPEINLLLVDSLSESLQKVHNGEADATLCALASFVSSVSMMGLADLEVIGGTDLSLQFSIGIRNDEPVLAGIIEKAVDNLEPDEISKTINQWLSVRIEKQFDYDLFWKLFAFIFMAMLFLLYRHYLLSRYHAQLQNAHNNIIKEKERAEKALQAEQEAIQKNLRFIDMISHEYRTPVSVISTNLDTMQMKSSKRNHDISPNLTKMKQATAKLVEIIETALNRDRLTEDKLVPHKHIFDLNKTIAATVLEIQAIHTDRTIVTSEELPKKSLFTGDAALIKIMLRNLVENALKYSSKTEAVIISSHLNDKNYILHIKDFGRGIPDQEQDKVFDKFHRATNTTDVAGAGVGLHMVKVIINQHNGGISISSPEAGGTIISVCLPIKQ